MSLRRKNWISLIALASLVACTTPPATQSKGTVTPTPAQQAAIDCGIDPFFLDENVKVSSFSRGPAKAGMCEELFKLTVGARIRNLTEEEGLALTKQIWDKERLRMEWAIGDSDAFWGTLMGKEKLEAALEKGISPIEVYGEMTARNWWAGVNRVNQIPIGKFKLNPEIVSDTNIEVVRGNNLLTRFELFDPMTAEEGKTRSKLFKFFNDKIKDLNRTYQIAGGRYRRRRLMHNYLAKAMSEEEFQVLKKDKDVHGIEFWEAPYSRPGKRFGLVRYPPVEVTNKKFEELMERTNQDIEEMRSGRSTKDPIAVAAEFQRAFVALHPMTNGNGRTSRILMNRILREFGLPPSLRSDINLDYGLPLEEHIQYVREGIINFIEKFSDESTLSGSISGRGFGTRLSTADLVKLAGENIDPALLITPRNLRKSDPGREKYDMAPESSKQVSHIGTKEFALGDDAFFHDRNLPYVARRDNSGWKLYPIDERTYELYSQGGALNQQRSVKRDLSPAARDQAAQNLKLFRAIRSGEVKLEDVRVERYDSIAAARQEDRMHLYPWQIKVALDGIRIKEDPDKDHPLEVLVRNRGDNTADPRIGRTALEKAFFSDAKEIDAGAVMGHYQHMQLTYEKMRASITHPKSALSADHQAALTAEIDASQAKMHRAARKLLEPFLAKVVEASKNPAAKEYLRQHPEFNMMWEYYTRSPLAYPTIEEAWKNGLRDTVTVVRSASTGDVERFGFMSDAQKRRYLFKVPAIGKFVQKVIQQLKIYSRQIVERGELEVDPNAEWQLAEVIARKVAPRVAANKDLRAMVDALLKYILVHPHEHRSFDPETASYFAVDFLHAQEDLGPKERLSTTVNPIYVLRADEKENVYDPKFAMSRPTIYMIQVPINAISVDNASRFVVQDEIRINSINWSRNARRATVWSMAANENDQFPMPAGPAPAEAQAVFDALHATPSGLGKAQAPVAGN